MAKSLAKWTNWQDIPVRRCVSETAEQNGGSRGSGSAAATSLTLRVDDDVGGRNKTEG